MGRERERERERSMYLLGSIEARGYAEDIGIERHIHSFFFKSDIATRDPSVAETESVQKQRHHHRDPERQRSAAPISLSFSFRCHRNEEEA